MVGERGLNGAILLPAELNTDLLGIGVQPPEDQQIDSLHIYDDSSQENKVGTLTSDRLTGLGLADDLTFDHTAFGEAPTILGGIGYRGVEVFNLMLGQGNDTLNIESTLQTTARHGGITMVHGGGNALLKVTGTFDLTGNTIRRTDGASWSKAGFEIGQQITLNGVLVGTIEAIESVGSGDNSVLRLASGATLTAATGQAGTLAVRDAATGQIRIGGDTIRVTGGGGSGSPLVVYGDTSQDGIWYSGDPWVADRSDNVLLGTKLFDQVGTADDSFRFGRANPFARSGNDVINASALDVTDMVPLADSLDANAGLTIYGGAGNDTIWGSQAGDHIAGGTGDDTIYGQQGIDHIYGDSGFNVDPITRTLLVPTADDLTRTGFHPDALVAGLDTLHGNEGDDIIFGDHGVVTQEVPTGRIYAGSLYGPLQTWANRVATFGLTSAASNEKLLTVGRIDRIETAQPANGANDTIYGNEGNDRILGGNGDDFIYGFAATGTSDGNNIILGDQGFIDYVKNDNDRTDIDEISSSVVAEFVRCCNRWGRHHHYFEWR